MILHVFLLLSLLAAAFGDSSCTLHNNCDSCRANSCGWCISSKRCVPDEPWMCQGDVDHIGSIGQTQECPSLESMRASYLKRQAPAPEEGSGSGEDSTASAAGAGAGAGGASPASSDWSPSDPAHVAELARRAALARSATAYGKAHPYTTLGVPTSATQREIRKAFKLLATRLHPDRNPQHAKDAEAAFADLSAANDLLSDQTLREAFDAEASGGQAFFHDEASFQASGQQFVHNLYPANGLVTELTEQTFSSRVQGDRIFLIQFYSPWCSHCQASAPLFQAAAEKLSDASGGGVEVDVAAVNCHKWPGLCSRFDVRAYPTVKIVSGRGMVQDQAAAAAQSMGDSEGLAAWAQETAGEWQWLYSASNTVSVKGEASLQAQVLGSADFWLVLFVDGEGAPCRTAKTNLMRLSASVPGRLRTGVVDCEAETPGWGEGGLCKRLGLPRPPHAPVLRAFHRGNKTAGDVGEELYNPAELESHVALKLVEAVLRLSGEQDEAALALAGKAKAWDKDPKEEEEEDSPTPSAPPQPRRPKWNGPPPRALPAGGFGFGGGSAPNPMLGRH